MPLFDEVLNLVARRVPLIVELKDQHSGALNKRLCELVDESLQRYGGLAAVQSFNPLQMKAFNELPGAKERYFTGQLGAVIDTETLPSPVLRLVIAHFVGTAAGGSHYFAGKGGDFEKSLGNIAMKIWPKTPRVMWTIRSEEDFEKYRSEGVDAIIFEGFIPKEQKTM